MMKIGMLLAVLALAGCGCTEYLVQPGLDAWPTERIDAWLMCRALEPIGGAEP